MKSSPFSSSSIIWDKRCPVVGTARCAVRNPLASILDRLSALPLKRVRAKKWVTKGDNGCQKVTNRDISAFQCFSF